VPDELLGQLVEAANRGPTASNVPYRHVMIVDDPSVIRAIKQISAALLANAPALLILFTDLRLAVDRVGRIGQMSSMIDSGAAGENVWLAATDLGLGTQFTMISAMPGIRVILGLPEHYRVDLIMPVGFAQTTGKRRRLSVVLNPTHYNQYGNTRSSS
jgi:nitroreductase